MVYELIDYSTVPSRKKIPVGWKVNTTISWSHNSSDSHIRRARGQNLWFAYVDGKMAIEKGGLPRMWNNPFEACKHVEENATMRPFRGITKLN